MKHQGCIHGTETFSEYELTSAFKNDVTGPKQTTVYKL